MDRHTVYQRPRHGLYNRYANYRVSIKGGVCNADLGRTLELPVRPVGQRRLITNEDYCDHKEGLEKRLDSYNCKVSGCANMTQPQDQPLTLRSGRHVERNTLSPLPDSNYDTAEEPNLDEIRNESSTSSKEEGENEKESEKNNSDQTNHGPRMSKDERIRRDRGEIYPHCAGDPNPIPQEAPKKAQTANQKVLRDYSLEMLIAYKRTKLRGELLWHTFVMGFRPHTIRSWTPSSTLEWFDLLTSRGVHVATDKSRTMKELIVDILYRDEHIKHVPDDDDETEKDKQPKPNQENKGGAEAEKDSKIVGSAGKAAKPNEDVPDPKPTRPVRTEKGDETEDAIKHIQVDDRETKPGIDPSEESDSSSDDEGSGDEKRKRSVSKNSPDTPKRQTSYSHDNKDHEEGYEDSQRGLGSNGRDLVKAFIGQSAYSGSYQENLEEVLDIYDELAEMCEVNPRQKRRAMAVILKGPARAYFARHGRTLETYEDAIDLLRRRYNNKEKQSRLLNEWQQMKLTKAMRDKPEQSEIDVFQSFATRAMEIQRQLGEEYQGDRYLRDRLQEAVDIPSIRDFLKDRPARTSQNLINRVANRLSDRPKTAGAVYANWTIGAIDSEDDDAYYGLGQRYGGDAKRQVKSFVKKGTGGYNRGENSRIRKRPKWMRGVKGCFVCRRDHMANQHHSRDEVTRAINKLKQKLPTVFLSQEDTAYISELFKEEHGHGESNEEKTGEAEADWAGTDENGSDTDSDLAFYADADLKHLQVNLANASFMHALNVEAGRSDIAMVARLETNDKPVGFEGLKVDTGANRSSIMSARQYGAYCETFGLIGNVRPSEKRVKGIGGRQVVVGVANIQIPFDKLGLIIDVWFAILDADVPTLLSLRDLWINGLDISIQECVIKLGQKKQELEMVNFFLVYKWQPGVLSYALYTEKELRTIHRTFGHPSIKATTSLLKRASGDELDTKTRKSIEAIASACNICQRNAGTPRRFKLTVGTSGLRFNHSVQIDTMFIRSKAVLHMVDVATHFSAACFLRSQSSEDIWKAILANWIYSYAGPPDIFHVDQGSAYISKEMRSNMETYGVRIREAPIETPGSIGIVERYHGPLRAAFERIWDDMDGCLTEADCLRMAIFSVNSTIGPEGLCPTLLVFGLIPRPARKVPSHTQIMRASAIEGGMQAAEKIQAKARIQFGLRHTGGPKGDEASTRLRQLPAGSPVLVYRTTTRKWEGPFIFISVEDETAIVQTGRGRRIFRSNCVKPTTPSALDDDEINAREEQNDEQEHMAMATNTIEEDTALDCKKGDEKKNRRIITAREDFRGSRRKEIEGLLQEGTFEIASRRDLPEGTRVFGSKFIDQLKRAGDAIRKKSRLVAQNYQDADAVKIATKAPTVQRFSQRVLLSLAASSTNMDLCTRDVTQAYVQSDKRLERPVFIKPPPEMGLSPDTVLRVVRPLYGIPESGLHWYLTYLEYHTEQLGMRRTTVDPCVFVRRDGGELSGLIALQVDDSLTVGTKEFLEEEKEAARQFKTKERTTINNKPTTFNGVRICKIDNVITMDQQDKIEKLETPSTQKGFTSKRAMCQYIGVCTRPDTCAPIQLIAPGKNDTSKTEYNVLRKIVNHLKATKERGLKFVPINMKTARLVLFTDSSFANATDFKSQLGFLLLIVDDNHRANIVHYGSSRCRRVTRSVMASELHSLTMGFDNAYVVQHLLMEITGRLLEIEAYIDSKTVFDVVAKQGRTGEKRLAIDVSALRESYACGELARLGWIQGKTNPADMLTKIPNSLGENALTDIMQSNTVRVNAIGWATVQGSAKHDDEETSGTHEDPMHNKEA